MVRIGMLSPRLLSVLALAVALGGCDSSSSDGDGDADGSGDDGPAGPPGSFSLLTYNVAGLPETFSSGDPVDDMPQISPLLNGYDLVLVQEDFWYHGELSAEAEHPHVSEPWSAMPVISDLGDGLNRFSQFPFTMHDRTSWPGCNGTTDCASDCLATKGWSMARHTLSDGVELDVYNLHKEAGGCPEDHAIRAAGAQEVVDAITERSEGRAVVLTGDFNLRYTDEEDVDTLQLFLDGASLEDACTVLDCGVESIDKVMFRSSDDLELVPTSWSQPPEFVDSVDGTDLSDHLPTAVDFDYTPR